MTSQTHNSSIGNISEEQLPIPKHKLKGWTHFLGLYAGEHVAATEFVFGATFVALGATMTDDWLEAAGEDGQAIVNAYKGE
mgnify:CR=1 FL=1